MPDDTTVTEITENELSITQQIYKRNVELFKERKRVEQLLYRVSEGIFAADEELKITLFNHALERMLGILASDALGKKVAEIIKVTSEDGTPLNWEEHLTPDYEHKNIPETALLVTPDKSYFVHIKISITETEQGYREYLVTMTDVTLEKQLEKSKDEFISITSHELRTPMSIIKSYLWMLNSGKAGELNEKQKGYLFKAQKGTERMLALINDILNISRTEQGKIEFKMEPIELPQLIQETSEELDFKAKEKGLFVKTDVPNDIPKVIADKQKLREVIINLGGNAIKYTDKGGLTIKLEKYGENAVKIIFIDTGRGIEEKDRARLFNKFQRLDNSYQTMAESGGTGLGLYIVRLYVSNMGGEVGVDSPGKDKGSAFWISLKASA